MMERRDRIGRRIGHNWWREYVWNEWAAAYQAWRLGMELEATGYATEEAEYRQAHPSPKFRDYLVALAGAGRIAA